MNSQLERVFRIHMTVSFLNSNSYYTRELRHFNDVLQNARPVVLLIMLSHYRCDMVTCVDILPLIVQIVFP